MSLIFLIFWVSILSAVTIGMFWWDKRQAIVQGRRIRESTLLMLALFGGSPGAKYGQRRFRHKTQKEPFRTTLNLILGFQLIAVPILWMSDPVALSNEISAIVEGIWIAPDEAKSAFPRRFGPGS